MRVGRHAAPPHRRRPLEGLRGRAPDRHAAGDCRRLRLGGHRDRHGRRHPPVWQGQADRELSQLRLHAGRHRANPREDVQPRCGRGEDRHHGPTSEGLHAHPEHHPEREKANRRSLHGGDRPAEPDPVVEDGRPVHVCRLQQGAGDRPGPALVRGSPAILPGRQDRPRDEGVRRHGRPRGSQLQPGAAQLDVPPRKNQRGLHSLPRAAGGFHVDDQGVRTTAGERL